MFNDLAYIKQAFEMIFKSLRYSNYRLDAVTGKLDSSGNLIADATQGLQPNYIWVRLGDDRTAVPMLSKIRAVAGIDVVVAYDRLWREDVVLEVNLTRTQLDYAAAYNVPQLPANMSTPTSARDIVPGGVFADIAGGLYVRVGPYWHEADYWDDITPLELTPTATSSKKSLAVVGVDRETNALTYTLTADRSLATNLIINAAPTSYAVADILAVVEADRTVDWRGAVELAHGDTEIDASKIVPLLWIRPVAIGADGSTAGITGLVPTPAAADDAKYLRGDMTWATPSGSSGALDLIILREEQAQNTSGGTFTNGAWRTRVLNTEVVDTGNHCSLSGNQFTLAAGTYRIRAFAPAFGVARNQTRLQNITDGTTELIGTSVYAQSTTALSSSQSEIVGRFTIASSKAFEIQHRCETTVATYGFGVESNFTTEVYTTVRIEKE